MKYKNTIVIWSDIDLSKVPPVDIAMGMIDGYHRFGICKREKVEDHKSDPDWGEDDE